MAKNAGTIESTGTISQEIKKADETTPSVDVEILLTKKDNNFIKKRSMLESILSGIKTKSTGSKPQPPKRTPASQVARTSNPHTKLDSIDQVLKDNSVLLQKSLLKHKPSILKNETRHREEVVDEAIDNSQGSSTDDILADMCEDDILNDLENLVIPIEAAKTASKVNQNLNTPVECIILDDVEQTASEISEKSPMFPNHSVNATLVEGSEQPTLPGEHQVFVPPSILSSGKAIVCARKDEKSREKIKTPNESKDVPENMPPLKKYSMLMEATAASPGNSKFESGESDFESSSVISGQDVDTISDTNVKYLNDDQISDYEGDRTKSKEADNAISEESNGESNKKENEATAVAKDNGDICPDKERSNGSMDEVTASVDDQTVTRSKQTPEETSPDDSESKNDCIIVYKIVETVAEPTSDPSNATAVKNKRKRAPNVKHLSASPSAKKTNLQPVQSNPDRHSATNNMNDFFKKCKKAHIKAPSGRRSKGKVQKAFARKQTETQVKSFQTGDDKKSIAIVGDSKTVNYCLKCSSIFETPACTYCVMKT